MHTFYVFTAYPMGHPEHHILMDCETVEQKDTDAKYIITQSDEHGENRVVVYIRLGLSEDEYLSIVSTLRAYHFDEIMGHCGDMQLPFIYLGMMEAARKRFKQDGYPTPWCSEWDPAPAEDRPLFGDAKPEFHVVQNARYCCYSYTFANKAYEASQKGEQKDINVIFGRDVDEQFLTNVHGSLSPNTAYIFSQEPSGKWQPWHVTYRAKTLNNFEAAKRRFGTII